MHSIRTFLFLAFCSFAFLQPVQLGHYRIGSLALAQKLEPLREAVEFPQDADWINTKNPLRMEQLQGKLVLLDFWTYCCINCMHVVPVLTQAEQEHSKHLVVIGVHTAKFPTERDTENIREAVMRNEIHHAVLNDNAAALWTEYGVNTWPTLVLIDPKGQIVWSHSGEIMYKDLDKVLKRAEKQYANSLSGKVVPIELESLTAKKTNLRFPGKVLADPAGSRLFIADSNHNRIVVSDFDGKLLDVIGMGAVGRKDGSYEEAQFNHPQGLAIYKNHLYVADTENHLIRRVDLDKKEVFTIAGNGVQQTQAFPGVAANAKIPKKYSKKPKSIELGSPWDVLVIGKTLYIALAGPHQIWRMPLDESSIAPFAGNGREDIVDGPLLPSVAYGLDGSSFAQPSGLATDGKNLFVADSEGSSIRAIPLDEKGSVTTVLGTSQLSEKRLFTNGDSEGSFSETLLQHPLAVGYFDKRIFVADTYNNKIKMLDATTQQAITIAGSTISGDTDTPPRFDEPAGLSIANEKIYIADTNNHKIRVWDLRASTLSTLEIQGLTEPGAKPTKNRTIKIPADAIKAPAQSVVVTPDATDIEFAVELELPKGWKINQEAPLGYVVLTKKMNGAQIGTGTSNLVKPPNAQFSIPVKIVPELQKIEIGVTYYFCRADGKGECLAETVAFEIQLQDKGTTSSGPTKLKHAINAPLGQ